MAGALSPPDPALTARFAADLATLWRGDGRLGVAVSGGPDSLALLLIAQAALPGRVAAATVD
ncbi:MAG: tRNA lysidine(34) synthetase TilS, partial [Novosphingobium sp.]